jgi:phosphoribosylformylglycinamidine synthase
VILQLVRLTRADVPDSPADAWRQQLVARGLSEADGWRVRSLDVAWLCWSCDVDADFLRERLTDALLDPVLHEPTLAPVLTGHLLTRRHLPAVTDPWATALTEVVTLLADAMPGPDLVLTGAGILAASPLPEHLLRLLTPWWANPLLHVVTLSAAPTAHLPTWPSTATASSGAVAQFDLARMDDAELGQLSEARHWGLSAEELANVREHFQHLGRPATDVEMEVVAQTWSEHCKHKVFAARIDYRSEDPDDPATEIPTVVDGLFEETIRRTTAQLNKPWLLSALVDNAGLVAFGPDDALAIKVETHNAPSLLDPFAGALTGVLGVQRDLLGAGMGSRPIANLDVFCVAPAGTPNPLAGEREQAGRILPPELLLEGIRRGVEVAGNHTGVPTVNGSLCVHPDYLARPLVLVGGLGWTPRQVAGVRCEQKAVAAGDRVVMVGGRIGRDGLHGATLSSQALTNCTPVTLVQLGDPWLHKRLMEFVLSARDRGLYRAVTDNGAGGLSSSVGELARLVGGARIDVGLAPVKATAMRPWELLVSESQERMTLAVPPARLGALLSLADQMAVEAVDLGEFNVSGRFEVRHDGRAVADLDLAWLHDGVPRLHLQARWPGPPRTLPVVPSDGDGRDRGFAVHQGEEQPYPDAASLLRAAQAVLAHPTVASKARLVRQYDHEVQARTVGKPLHAGAWGESPADAAVLALDLQRTGQAAVLGHGLAPLWGRLDPYRMGQLAVDEAVRNVVAAGAEFGRHDPDKVLALVDNFCWPEPRNAPRLAAALVRAAFGMRNACLALGLPLVSGKDSVKNDLRATLDGEAVHFKTQPTLLITALGRMPTLRPRPSAWQQPGDEVLLLGPEACVSLAASVHADLGRGTGDGVLPAPDFAVAATLYDFLGSPDAALLCTAHDCSDGGWLVALAEASFAHGLGVRLHEGGLPTPTAAFGEGFHRLLVSCRPEHTAAVCGRLDELRVPHRRLGVVTSAPVLDFGVGQLPLAALYEAWSGEPHRPQPSSPAANRQPNCSAGRPSPKRVLVLAGDGLNCERETADACRAVGLAVDVRTVAELVAGGIRGARLPAHYGAVILPGGFAHGDAWDAGRLLALALQHRLGWDLRGFARDGGFVLGVCNGCQALVRAGVFGRSVTLTLNGTGRFIDQWVALRVGRADGWLRGLQDWHLPIRHREGRFLGVGRVADGGLGDVALRYANDVNGSEVAAAGLSAESGRLLALMPHPEAALWACQEPGWRPSMGDPLAPGPGYALFANLADMLASGGP